VLTTGGDRHRLAVDMDIHGYIHVLWISGLGYTVDISMDM